jgi:hypothetical protein
MDAIPATAPRFLRLPSPLAPVSLSRARLSPPAPGRAVLVDDFSAAGPAAALSRDGKRGSWQLVPFRRDDGTGGRMLLVNERLREAAGAAVPPELSLPLDLPGFYALWIGVPTVELEPVYPFPSGVDVAFDGEGFVHVGPEYGTRREKILRTADREVFCFWRCARLEGRSLRFRVPFGTFQSFPWGLVRALVSSVCLVRLGEAETAEYETDRGDRSTKRLIVVNDGFSHYFQAAEPGLGIDARFVDQYAESDVKALMFQTPSTGVASWPSRATSLYGKGLTEEEWAGRRLGDRRTWDYINWAVANGQEGMRVISRRCRELGMEFHASLRMNLFWKADQGILGRSLDRMCNGDWWFAHPASRKPGSPQIDYADPAARAFIVSLLMELAENYDMAGIHLDFTRWPPVADPARHGPEVLTGFLEETRLALDAVGRSKGGRLSLSASVVDGYHARRPDGTLLTLADQRIDLDAWTSKGLLDFVCVEAWDYGPHLGAARRAGIPYYHVMDGESIDVPGGFRDDPQWKLARKVQEDPVPGEELREEIVLNSSLDPSEYQRFAAKRLLEGGDGLCIVNQFLGWRCLNRLGHAREMADWRDAGGVWCQRAGGGIRLEG